MTVKNDVQVVIDGKMITLSGYESNEYMQKLASHIDAKIKEYSENESFRRHNYDMRHIMLSTLFAVHSDNDAVKNAQYRQLHHFPSQCHFNIQQSGFQGASTAFLSCLQAFKIDSEYHGVRCPTAE